MKVIKPKKGLYIINSYKWLLIINSLCFFQVDFNPFNIYKEA
jgi:hypothetical protein